MRPTNQVGAAALAYAQLGYRVLPLPIRSLGTPARGGGCSARAATRLVGRSASIP
jgi:hypothetical protein